MRQKHVTYTPEVAARVVELTARGMSLGEICQRRDLPSLRTFIQWRRARPELERAYLEACAAFPRHRGPVWSGLPGGVAEARKAAARRTRDRGAGRGNGWGSRYTPELAEEVCRRIMAGASMIELDQDRSLPSVFTLCRWLRQNPAFQRLYAAACEIRAEALADEAGAIADNASLDLIPGPGGRLVPNLAAVGRARLAVRQIQWRAAKLHPKRYGLHAVMAAPAQGPMSHEDALEQLD
jgi:hypothetical protein